jgi:hypothetical protein
VQVNCNTQVILSHRMYAYSLLPLVPEDPSLVNDRLCAGVMQREKAPLFSHHFYSTRILGCLGCADPVPIAEGTASWNSRSHPNKERHHHKAPPWDF